MVLISALFQSHTFQNFVIQKVVSTLKQGLGVEVSIESIGMQFPGKVVVNHLKIEDQKGDSLIYIQSLKVILKQINTKTFKLGFVTTEIDGALINFGHYLDEEDANYQFFIDYFAPPRTDTAKVKTIWTIHFNKVTLKNSEFRWFDKNGSQPDNMKFNPSDLRFQNINGEISDFYIIDDSLAFNATHLSVFEHSGIKVEHLESVATIHSKGMKFDKLKIQTENSSIDQFISFEFNDWSDMSRFITDVDIKVDMVNTFLAMKDLMPFNHTIEDLAHMNFRIQGDASGRINKLRIRDAVISTLDETIIEGKFDIRDLPDIEEVYFSFDITKLNTNKKELATLFKTEMPGIFDGLGNIEYKGRFNGFYNNFVTYGDFNTRLGDLKTDLYLDFSNGFDLAKYSGSMETNGFELGQLTKEEKIGKIAFSVKLKDGQGLSPDKFAFKVKGEVPLFVFNDYPLRKTKLEGEIKDKIFTGKANIHDPNVYVDFDGMMNFTPGEEETDFTAHIGKINLKELRLDTTSSGFSGFVNMKTIGINPDNLEGSISAWSMIYVRNEKAIKVDEIEIHSKYVMNQRTIEVQSPFFAGKITGDYSFKELPNSIMLFLSDLMPGLIDAPVESEIKNSFTYNIRLLNLNPILNLFVDDMNVGPGYMSGNFSAQQRSLDLSVNLDYFRYGKDSMSNPSVLIKKLEKEELIVTLSGNLTHEGSKIKADRLYLIANVNKNEIDFHLNALDSVENVSISTSGILHLENSEKSLMLKDMSLHLKEKDWFLEDTLHLVFGEDFVLKKTMLRSGNELIELELQSKANANKLIMTLNNFDLGFVNNFLNKDMPDFFGLANGNVTIEYVNKNFMVSSNLTLENFAIDNDTIGTLTLNSQKVDNNRHEIAVFTKTGLFNGMQLTGTIGTSVSDKQLDLELVLPSSDISVFSRFIEGISNVKGQLAAQIQVRGSMDNPEFKGNILTQNVSFLIDYMQSVFTLNSEVDVTNDKLTITKGTLKDEKNNSAEISGHIAHKDFKDWKFDVFIKNMKNMFVLNTGKKDNEIFYGQAYVDGNARFFGSFEEVEMDIYVVSKSGTTIKLPIEESEASGPASYITFKSEDTIKHTKATDLGFLKRLSLETVITPAAEIQLIFNEQTGDIIKGSGSGNLKFNIDNTGDFTMAGMVVIEKGEYNYVAFNNLVNKKFFLQRGGTISWNGDPLMARINLTAYNIQKVSPLVLLSGSQAANQDGAVVPRVDARSEINLKGNLFQPEITFGLDIPNIENTGMNELSSVLQRIKNDPDEMNRQVFSLLVFGSFMPPSFASSSSDFSAGQSAVSTGIADLISNQVDAWLSQINPRWLVDFRISNNNPDQAANYALTLGYRFLNDRLIIDATVNSNNMGGSDVNAEYLLRRDGRLRLRGYNRSGINPLYNSNSTLVAPVTTQGVGLYYRRDFNKLFRKPRKAETESQ
jgi:hypothetical protein